MDDRPLATGRGAWAPLAGGAIGVVRIPFRLCAVAFAFMGAWFAFIVPLHPNILTEDVAHAVLTDGTWRLSHVGMFLTGFAGVLAACGLAGMHGDRLGRRGQATLAFAVVASIGTVGTGMAEATLFPVIARHNPGLLDFHNGPIFTSPLFGSMSSLFLLLPIAFAALGALARQDGYHRNAGTALAVSGVAFFALGMWFVPVVGFISCVAFGGVLAWWGVLVWQHTNELRGVASAP